MNAQEIANRRAEKRSSATPPNSGGGGDNGGLTTLEEILASHKTERVTLSTGRTFDIQSISPGEFAVSTGSPLIQRLVDSGIRMEDEDYEEKAQEYMEVSISDEDWLDIILSEEHKTQIARVLTMGITSIKFLSRTQANCPEGYASLDNLNLQEQSELFVAILNLTVSAEDIDSFRLADGESNG